MSRPAGSRRGGVSRFFNGKLWRLKLRSLWDRGGLDRDLQDELRAHVAMETEAGIEQGLSPEEARRRALSAFGGVERYREESREQWSFRWWDDALRDVRQAFRSFARSPVFTVVAVLSLALGLGANTAIFSVLHGVVLEPPPFAEPDRLAMVWETDRASGTNREPASVPDFLDLDERSGRFRELAAFRGLEVTWLPTDGEPRRLAALAVTHDFLPMVGLRPVIGRPMERRDDEPGAPPVAWLAEDLWRTAYGGDPAVLGSVVDLDGVTCTVAGVMPRGAEFGFRQVLGRAAYSRSFGEGGDVPVALWLPLQPDPERYPRQTHPIFVLGRLAETAGVETAQEEITSVMAELEAMYPENRHRGGFVEPLTEVVLGPVRPALWLLLGAVGLMVLIACVNVASLLLARGASRTREVAVRAALGAGAGRLGRQFLVEGLVLAGLAGVVGVGVAKLALEGLLAWVPGEMTPRLAEVQLNAPVLAVSLGVVVFTGLVFGLVPWLQARLVQPAGALHGQAGQAVAGGSPDRARLRGLLVVAELALAVTLVIGAGLLLRSFLETSGVDLGFHTEDLLKAEVQLPGSRYPRDFSVYPDWPAMHGFREAVLGRLRALPGVESAAVAGSHPLAAGFTNSFVIEGREEEASDQPEISVRQVTPEYFETVGVPVKAGRSLRATDDRDAVLVALLNQAAAERFFRGESPVGERITLWGATREVVGVVGDERFHGPEAPPPPALYLPMAQAPGWNLSLLVRAAAGRERSGSTSSLAPAVRTAVHEVDPALAVFGVETLESTFARTVAYPRLLALLVGLFAAVALLLALLGVHGVLAYTVSQRRKEMGIRMALGAAPRRVLASVLGQGFLLAVLGLAVGAASAFGLTRFLEGLLFQVDARDPGIFGLVAAAVLATALLASLIPALRATRIDPARTLRED